jgi:hypothetical protein
VRIRTRTRDLFAPDIGCGRRLAASPSDYVTGGTLPPEVTAAGTGAGIGAAPGRR